MSIARKLLKDFETGVETALFTLADS